MIYTSYLGNLKNIPDEIKKVSIMRYTPDWSKEYIDKIDLNLAPSKTLFDNYKNKEISPAAYKRGYLDELSKLDISKVAKKYNDSVLLCTCKLGNMCHRHLLTEYLLKNNIKIAEITKGANFKDIKVEYIKPGMKKGVIVEESYFKLNKLPNSNERNVVINTLWFRLQLLLRRMYNGDRIYITKEPIGTSVSSLGMSMPTVAISFSNMINKYIIKHIKG